MPLSLFLLVLLAAALHASWNAIVKRGPDKFLGTVLVTGSAALLSAAVLPWLPLPAPQSLPWLAASVMLQVAYYALVARCYQQVDMSLAYPLMRGCAPILVALAGSLLGQPLPPLAWAGIVLVSTGILCMALGARGGQLRLPLLTALMIATYTLVDAQGARLSGHALGYTLWLFLLSGLPLPLWALLRRHRQVLAYARAHWPLGVVGGIGTTASYAMALWAMTQVPVAMVSALRESSILFALLISVFLLHERVPRVRWLAATLMVCGVVVLRQV
ncbi:EamA family transporter [Stenotrophomonas sp. 24(2023)]|uniref:EamA family transporter n=1 Tax=Stenotrophomonas sp. 24(2023) TaxID=3068324 RepID=UPI0027E19C0F|nr:EamA family transporter [Stenotrophomonas sp. 24(2023)]WMJ67764.1 EamA family transporter [Stenotrophomonas sp. 24(2023)]